MLVTYEQGLDSVSVPLGTPDDPDHPYNKTHVSTKMTRSPVYTDVDLHLPTFSRGW